MATLKAVVRKQRADGFFPVYIRIVHRSRMGYIKTDKVISPKHITASGEFKDVVVNEYCSRIILKYTDLLNRKDVSAFSVMEVIEYLTRDAAEVSFSDYARKHIDKLINTGHERTAKNYRLAVAHLERYIGSNRLMFSQLSSAVLKRWITDLAQTNRAKEMYPVCVRQIFKAALLDFNDEEKGICRIKFNPWVFQFILSNFIIILAVQR